MLQQVLGKVTATSQKMYQIYSELNIYTICMICISWCVYIDIMFGTYSYLNFLFCYLIFSCRIALKFIQVLPIDVALTLSHIADMTLTAYHFHGPLARYVKLRVAHAPGMSGTFSRHRRLANPTWLTARAWRTCREACRDRLLAVSFEVGGGENVPGISGACATRKFTYLEWGPFLCKRKPPCFVHFAGNTHIVFVFFYIPMTTIGNGEIWHVFLRYPSYLFLSSAFAISLLFVRLRRNAPFYNVSRLYDIHYPATMLSSHRCQIIAALISGIGLAWVSLCMASCYCVAMHCVVKNCKIKSLIGQGYWSWV